MNKDELRGKLKEHVQRVNKYKDKTQNEENTKSWLITPLISALGYDTNSPEVSYEYTRDVGIKKGEKVDYAILDEYDRPFIFIEAKASDKVFSADNYGQLFRYFSIPDEKIKGVGKVARKLAVLTNGVIYKFYSDFDEVNRMDVDPFYEIDFCNMKDEDYDFLFRVSKGNFDINGRWAKNTIKIFEEEFVRWLLLQRKAVSDSFINAITRDDFFSDTSSLDKDEVAEIVKEKFGTMLNVDDTELLENEVVTAENHEVVTGQSGVFKLADCSKDMTTNAKFIGLVFEENFYSYDAWTDMFSWLCKYMLDEKLCTRKTISAASDGCFSLDSDKFRTPKEYDGIYFESNYSSIGCINNFKRTILSLDIDINMEEISLVICTRDDYAEFKSNGVSKEEIYRSLTK